jgi:PhnB protein
MPDVKPIPDGYPQVIPYLSMEGAADAIEFYCSVLGATERVRMDAPEGKIGHAELDIGGSVIMLADVFPEMGGPTAKSLGGTPITIMVYVDDVDKVFAKALEKGATETSPVQNQFYGDRSGVFEDAWGYKWNVATHVEDVSPEEMDRRAAEAMGGPPS